jgi:glycosyltransferase involved in cell wall biosynthesis
LLRIQYIPCLHGGNLPDRIKKNPILSRQLFAHAYTNVVVSGYLEDCVKKHNWPSDLIPNSIRLSDYPFFHRSSVAPRLLWVRSFHKIYNPQMAIKVIYELSKTYPGASLTMVGPDKDGSMEECKKLADELGIGGCVAFTGRLPMEEWVKLSAGHDIFINTTNFDNLPVSVIEAMALGMPVVSTDVGGLQYLITNNVNGFLVPPNNVSAMKQRVEYIISNPDIASAISERARRDACAYSMPAVLQRWNNLLGQVR